MRHAFHRFRGLVPLLILSICLATTIHAQQPAAPLSLPNAPSVPWLTADDYAKFRPEGAEARFLDVAVATLETPAGSTKGFQFTTREVSYTPYGEQASFVNPRGLDAGDVLLAHFWMRTTRSLAESGEGVTTFLVERQGTFEKSLAFNAKVANQWKEFYLPFTAKSAFKPGEARVIFRLGTQRQTVEIAGLEIRNYQRGVALSALPLTKPDLSYAGMEPDAPWRAEAEARIAKYRQSTLTVEVVDPAGKPVPNATVQVRQTRHAFGFGSAVNAEHLAAAPDPATGHNLYAETIEKNFNVVTIDNALKWPRWAQDKSVGLKAAQWCKEHNVALRGHNMIWPSWRHFPDNIKLLKDKPDQLRAAALSHVEDVGTAVAPYASVWDVINETYDNHDLMDILGEHILVEIFETAKKVDPHATLFINDYNILSNNGLDHGHQNAYEKVIQYLVDQHAPLEGVGMQGHFGQQFTPPTRMLAILDRYAKFHLPIQVTEFTVDGDDAEENAHFMTDAMTVLFSYPSATAFVFWGAFDGIDYVHKGLLFDSRGQYTKVGQAWRDLVFKKWWTQEDRVTPSSGTVALQGYHGNYDISAADMGGTMKGKATVELKPGGTTVKVTLGR